MSESPQPGLPTDWIARVGAQKLTAIPEDLYIPPEALRVFLEAFEGPLDLLLYLIRRHNLDILQVNVALVTRQYMEYVDLMRELRLELAAEYLLMAALLTEIKSHSLLPRLPNTEDALQEEEADPSADLIRRLQAYQQVKQAAETLDTLPRVQRDTFNAQAAWPEMPTQLPPPKVELQDILLAFAQVLKRLDLHAHHHVQMDTLSTYQRIQQLRVYLQHTPEFYLSAFVSQQEGRMGIVVTFLALLELCKNAYLILEVVDTPHPDLLIRAI